MRPRRDLRSLSSHVSCQTPSVRVGFSACDAFSGARGVCGGQEVCQDAGILSKIREQEEGRRSEVVTTSSQECHPLKGGATQNHGFQKTKQTNARGALFAKSTLPPEAWLLTRKTFICSVLQGQRLKPARLTGHRGLNRRAEERSGFCEREPGPKVRAEVAGPRASHALRAGSRTLARFLLSLLSGRNQMGRTLGKVSSGPRPHAIIQRVLTSFLRQLSPAGIPGRNPERDFIISILILAAPPLKKKKMTSFDYLILGLEYRALTRLALCLEFKYKSH